MKVTNFYLNNIQVLGWIERNRPDLIGYYSKKVHNGGNLTLKGVKEDLKELDRVAYKNSGGNIS